MNDISASEGVETVVVVVGFEIKMGGRAGTMSLCITRASERVIA